MNKFIKNRVIKEAKYMLETEETLREIAKKFGFSKSTIHKDLNERLYKIDKELNEKIKTILMKHLAIRHIRGGESTKMKYLKCK